MAEAFLNHWQLRGPGFDSLALHFPVTHLIT